MKKRLLWAGMAVILAIVAVAAQKCATRTKRKELLVYCGVTMVQPVHEIAHIIEAQYNVDIHIVTGGSGNLFKAIQTHGVGDIYFPGKDSYIEKAREQGLVADAAEVGENKAALMVQKGNPKNITADLNNLADERYYVVIGNEMTGSIGKETQRILHSFGNYEEVTKNARLFATDSKDLVRTLKGKQADITLNWYATSLWPENEPYVDTLAIPDEYAQKQKLVMAVLTSSQHPEIAREFLRVAASEKGHVLFKQYGLYGIE